MKKYFVKYKSLKFLRIFFLWYYRNTKNHKQIVDILYYIKFKETINWKNPKDLNQWINWLEFNTDTSLWSLLSDKYKVRNYVKEKGFEENLIPLLGVWDDPEKINIDSLPKGFVLKMNNGSGDVLIIKDKTTANLDEIKNHFRKLFYSDFSLTTGERHYKEIKPLIMAEQLLDVDKQSIPSTSMIDYKIWCFDGKPECIRVYYNREKDKVNLDTYDINWENRPELNNYSDKFLKSDISLPKPDKLDEMLYMASKLSEGFPQVRVDLYESNGKIYFGELTFTSSTGKMTSFSKEYLTFLGNKVAKIIRKDSEY